MPTQLDFRTLFSSSQQHPAAPVSRRRRRRNRRAGRSRPGTSRIIRDDWGIAHIYGKTDADAVFGMIYAQAEDDFNRVETNYINAMGRLAEAEGESKIYQDLRMKLFIDPAAHEDAIRSEPGLAEGVNECVRRRPELLPRQTSRSEAARHPAI